MCACESVSEPIYGICVSRKNTSKMDNHTRRDSSCIRVSKMRRKQEDGENMRTREQDCVCVCVRERKRETGSLALFSRAGYQAARQQGGIITEAVTFLWFL